MAQVIGHNDIGDVWKPQATFTVSGNPTDPTTLVTRVMEPDGTITTASYSVATLTSVSSPVAKTTTGVFVHSITLDSAGHWYARFEGTGAATAAEDYETIVDPSPFYDNGGLSDRALVGLGETKDWLAQRNVDTSNDQKIVQSINGASEEIMRVSGREFKPHGTNPEERIFYLGWNGNTVDVGDLQTATTASTSISVYQTETATLLTTFASTDYIALPQNREPWRPVTGIYFQRGSWGYNRSDNYLSVTGYWGFPQVPENIKHATMDTVAFWLDRDVEHFRQDLGIGNTGEAGQTVFVGGSMPTVFSLPPEAYKIAIGYRRKLVC